MDRFSFFSVCFLESHDQKSPSEIWNHCILWSGLKASFDSISFTVAPSRCPWKHSYVFLASAAAKSNPCHSVNRAALKTQDKENNLRLQIVSYGTKEVADSIFLHFNYYFLLLCSYFLKKIDVVFFNILIRFFFNKYMPNILIKLTVSDLGMWILRNFRHSGVWKW